VRRHAQLIAADLHDQIGTIRRVAQHEGLSQSCLDRIDKRSALFPKCRRRSSSSRVMCTSR
jgi:hypothetical protein